MEPIEFNEMERGYQEFKFFNANRYVYIDGEQSIESLKTKAKTLALELFSTYTKD